MKYPIAESVLRILSSNNFKLSHFDENFKILNNQVPLTNLNNYTRVNFYLYVMFLVQDVSGTNAPGVAVDTSSKMLPVQLPTTSPGPQAATPANVAPLANAYVRSGCVNWCPM